MKETIYREWVGLEWKVRCIARARGHTHTYTTPTRYIHTRTAHIRTYTHTQGLYNNNS